MQPKKPSSAFLWYSMEIRAKLVKTKGYFTTNGKKAQDQESDPRRKYGKDVVLPKKPK